MLSEEAGKKLMQMRKNREVWPDLSKCGYEKMDDMQTAMVKNLPISEGATVSEKTVEKYLITRADDFGSAAAANEAIIQALERGDYLRNISCMAVGPKMEQGAEKLESLRRERNICLGLHAVLNSEWQETKFYSVLPKEQVPTLVDENGVFAMHPMCFEKKRPDVGECIGEISAQLDKLTQLGLTIEYLDTHMLPEVAVPGLKEALTDFAKCHGLIEQRWFYTFPGEAQPKLEGEKTLEEDAQAYRDWFGLMEEGRQYINVLHPASYSKETELFYNQLLTGNRVAKSREAERRLLQSGMLEKLCKEKRIRCIRYTEAKEYGDTLIQALKYF